MVLCAFFEVTWYKTQLANFVTGTFFGLHAVILIVVANGDFRTRENRNFHLKVHILQASRGKCGAPRSACAVGKELAFIR